MTGETISIRPQPPTGEPAYRFQWDTPIVISPHDSSIVYIAGNKVLKAPDTGLTFVGDQP